MSKNELYLEISMLATLEIFANRISLENADGDIRVPS